MIRTYKISLRHQYYSLKEGLPLLVLIPIILIIIALTNKMSIEKFLFLFIGCLLFNLVFFLPAFLLHFNYYFQNRNTVLTVDGYSKHCSITLKKNTTNFNFDEIHLIEQHLGIYYKNKIDHVDRRAAPWSNYGYLKLKLKSGQIYFLSSLMIDIQNPPFKISQTEFRFVPFIKKEELTIIDKRKLIEQERKYKYENYLLKFKNLPKETLQEKIDNAQKYEPKAIEACKTILKIPLNK